MENNYLSMWCIPDQRPSRGSIGVAHTAFSRSGRAEAGRTLAEEAVRLWHARPPDRAHEQQTDALALEHLVGAVESKVATFLQGTPTAEQLEERLKLLTELQARNATASYRQVAHAIELVVAERTGKVGDGLGAAFDANPVAVGEALAHVRDALRGLVWPTTETSAALKRFDRLVQKLRDLPEFEARLTPQATSRVSAYLVEEARAVASRATHEVLEMLTADALRRHLPSVTAALCDLEERGVRYQQQVTAMVNALADQVRVHHQDEQGTASSIALLLPGPSQHEIVGALMVAKDCTDITTLATKMIGEFELRLRDRASRSYPHAASAGLPSLMLHLPYTELVTVWTRLLDAIQRVPGFSLYERLLAFGLDAAADQLWALAAPTCFFAGRDHEVFGVGIQEIAVVALPPARGGPDDERIRGELAQRFRAKAEDNCCQVTDGAGSDELTVCRILAGFPIGIEYANHALLQSYVAAGNRGHLPHLVGIIGDSELGRPSPAHLALLHSNTTSNGNATENNHERH